jgi:hypothetical protein
MEKDAVQHLPMFVDLKNLTWSGCIFAQSGIIALRLTSYDQRVLASWAINLPWAVGTGKDSHAKTKVWWRQRWKASR